ncbi:hypothetical protein RHOFW104T7_00745 [Rhodanobacter thiooxydans]|uniref:Uncharacterized protein n=1 Tax=Rhodanobacter thiooxydans TaxID=416169 RepID=A0A154QDW1_9GAMM|nr:hypothetical protein RHOFW104T7_00745 [Rhodanobacter thiooxydans]
MFSPFTELSLPTHRVRVGEATADATMKRVLRPTASARGTALHAARSAMLPRLDAIDGRTDTVVDHRGA